MRHLPVARVISGSSLLLFLLSAPLATAQETLWKRVATSAGDSVSAVSSVGDLDGDGLPDLLVGAKYDSAGTGSVRALRGSDGSELFVIYGNTGSAYFGSAVAGLGDVDGDGVPDFVVGAPKTGGTGSVGSAAIVYSGATRTALYTLTGSTGESMGVALAEVGDVDGDLVNDFAVSHGNCTYVAVHSGATGALLHTVTASDASPTGPLASVDDVDGDGIRDLLTGGCGDETLDPSEAGVAMLFSGATGARIWTWVGTGGMEQDFGSSLAGVGDLDGDGVPDLAIGEPRSSNGFDFNHDGNVYLYSSATGALLHQWSGLGDRAMFGASLAAIGDVTGDGIPDVMVGARGANQFFDEERGVFYVYSGATLEPIVYRLGDEIGSRFGETATAIGDVDGDGAVDFAVTALLEAGYGALHLIHGNDLFFSSNIKLPVAGANVILTTSAGDPGQPALLVLEEVDGVPLFRPIVTSPLNANGEWRLFATVPSGLAGHTVALRAWSLDANGKLVTSSPERLEFR